MCSFQSYSFDENLCLATRQNDVQWSAFVSWTVMATVYAEEHRFYKHNASSMPNMRLFGSEFEVMFRNIVATVGNYAEIYERTIQRIAPRSGRNMLVTAKDNTPLHYVPPGFNAIAVIETYNNSLADSTNANATEITQQNATVTNNDTSANHTNSSIYESNI